MDRVSVRDGDTHGSFQAPGEITALMTALPTPGKPSAKSTHDCHDATVIIPNLYPHRRKCRCWGHSLRATGRRGSCALPSSTADSEDLRLSPGPRDPGLGKAALSGVFKGTCFLRRGFPLTLPPSHSARRSLWRFTPKNHACPLTTVVGTMLSELPSHWQGCREEEISTGRRREPAHSDQDSCSMSGHRGAPRSCVSSVLSSLGPSVSTLREEMLRFTSSCRHSVVHSEMQDRPLGKSAVLGRRASQQKCLLCPQK